ncbi:MAG: diguanylate cyclase [Nocardioides sp.]
MENAARADDGTSVVIDATRRLLRVTTRTDVADILRWAIVSLGGELVGNDQSGPGHLGLLPVGLCVEVGTPQAVRSIDPDDGRLSRHLAGLVDDALVAADRCDAQNRLDARATVDHLTGVASKSEIGHRLALARPGDIICVLDLDGFKALNDTHGHLVGDEVLHRFGTHLRERTRSGDFVARFGGDEFLVILDAAPLLLAHERMTELADSWAESASITTSVSIGVAPVTGAGGLAAADSADRAMYRAKRAGEAPVEMARRSDEVAVDDPAEATYQDYLRSLGRADASNAVDVLQRALHRGVPRPILVRDVIARGQRRLGARSAAGNLTIGQEHAATRVAEEALSAIAPRRSVTSTSATRVVFACTEGEWHTLPARLAAALAGSDDLEIIMLGGGVPAADLGASLRVMSPDVLALSVTLGSNLIGAYRCIRAARAEGVRVVVGGAAWGATQRRAARFGVHYLDDPAGLADHLRDVAALPDTPAATIPDEAFLLERPDPELIRAALTRWAAVLGRPPEAATLRAAGEALDWIVRHAAAAVACDDATVLAEGLRVGSTIDHETLLDMATALSREVAPTAPLAAGLIRDEIVRHRADALLL